MSNNNKNMTFFWKKSLFPLCSFSISKCLPTILSSTPNSPRHHLSDDDDDDQCQTTNTSLSYNSSSSSSIPLATTKNFMNSLFSDSAAEFESEDTAEAEADFAAVFASQRFFFSSPGSSNSIVDEPREKDKDKEKEKEMIKRHVVRRRRTASFDAGASGVEVRKYSVDPRLDFRRSMQEMIEARNVQNNDVEDDDRSDLEYLHELLLCFLSLNPKETHRFVISAFTDIVVDILSSSPSPSPEDEGRRCHEVKIRRKRNALRRLSM